MILYLLSAIVLSLSVAFPIWAQGTGGKEFWLTFGSNGGYSYDEVNLQVLIISGDEPIEDGKIYFTNLGTFVSFTIAAHDVFTYTLTYQENQAVYNETTGESNRSIRITSDKSVTVYALNQYLATVDATNILPVKALGDDYYQISYTSLNGALDAYAVIAIENNTSVYHEGILVAMLDAGEVYYRTSSADMTGAHITANRSVAFFALNQAVKIPVEFDFADCVFQQLDPVSAWGQTFFVPVSHLAKNRIRIVASRNGTGISQTGGVHKFALGGQTDPVYTLNAGQYIELEILLSNSGCYIQSDNPIAVCSYLVGSLYNGLRPAPAQCWISSIEQTVTDALIAPFVLSGQSVINEHHALVIADTKTKDDIKVSINGAEPVLLSGIWIDNTDAGISFYNMSLANVSGINYRFTSDEGIIVLCCGVGNAESYYYLGFSAMRNLKASFYANDVCYQDLPEHVFCVSDVDFSAEITGLHSNPGSLKWYIDGVEEIAARDKLKWYK